MPADLRGKRIAVLATDGFEQSELTEPVRTLRRAGAMVDVVSPKSDEIQGMQHHEKGDKVAVDRTLDQVQPAEYSGLVLPGGVANPDALRTDPRAVAFVRAFFDERKPVAAICHGPWMLVEADVVADRSVTSWPSLKTDLTNAGARWIDRDAVVDKGLVTSRKPADLPVFCQKAIELFGGATAA
ncbi:MAG: type 1 glutamine amidotransferase domain-containing protein [Stellaceae bacterium]